MDSFLYRAFDGKGSFDDAKVTINVTNLNQNPNAADDKFETPHDVALNGNVIINDNDPDGDGLLTSLLTSPTNGNLVLQSNGNFTYTPFPGFFGADSFEYLLSDGQGGTDVGKVEIKVTAGTILTRRMTRSRRPRTPSFRVTYCSTTSIRMATSFNWSALLRREWLRHDRRGRQFLLYAGSQLFWD